MFLNRTYPGHGIPGPVDRFLTNTRPVPVNTSIALVPHIVSMRELTPNACHLPDYSRVALPGEGLVAARSDDPTRKSLITTQFDFGAVVTLYDRRTRSGAILPIHHNMPAFVGQTIERAINLLSPEPVPPTEGLNVALVLGAWPFAAPTAQAAIDQALAAGLAHCSDICVMSVRSEHGKRGVLLDLDTGRTMAFTHDSATTAAYYEGLDAAACYARATHADADPTRTRWNTLQTLLRRGPVIQLANGRCVHTHRHDDVTREAYLANQIRVLDMRHENASYLQLTGLTPLD